MIEAGNLDIAIAGRLLLANLNFRIDRGERIAILGMNGAGKTTLLRTIAGLHRSARGSLRVAGRSVETFSATERARSMALMLGDESGVEAMPVRDAVAVGRYAYHHWWDWREQDEDSAAITNALAAVHMSGFAQRDVATLSSGERQRVWLVLGLAQEAPLLLLDEPTGHLDVRASHEMLELLHSVSDSGKTVVCVLHDINAALDFAHRILVIGAGKILAFDTPRAIVENAVLDAAYGITMQSVTMPGGALRVFAGSARIVRPQVLPHDI